MFNVPVVWSDGWSIGKDGSMLVQSFLFLWRIKQNEFSSFRTDFSNDKSESMNIRL